MPGFYGSQLQIKFTENTSNSTVLPAFGQGLKDFISIWLNVDLLYIHFIDTCKLKWEQFWNDGFSPALHSTKSSISEFIDLEEFFDIWVFFWFLKIFNDLKKKTNNKVNT